ncbi:hypothetical protein SAMCFNEI73_Ch1716 [Sinorhizobium americanum]|uniref:Uncharacterized protein n=1 Tax=Sinorhizobium americanum TaxID=194963 RepID=A0A1L3LLN1_9HYPH|nr:hypothetical protein SAMCCGM7_Ch1706 [Sinorhizobium americanum CCGM7]APG91010.1 hypothetical protein SAMCFNEI73_Ch1716 [Sinorhizobium americanum]
MANAVDVIETLKFVLDGEPTSGLNSRGRLVLGRAIIEKPQRLQSPFDV